ncbi:uncharacterized protein FOBCDRAFT_241933 [Fusarium oxysporum Fo47]|uniref:uncharacterized protein n=1 Tax=Fusarium oxysporum Fo47 TaxID=660027 RepID=UPI00286984F9|nr:uncharacterized protein FOBCDRAFT_241933 [Fusarium oxysporum Fo47]QKD57389.2 hypothetical protein FOBCDRAFT_241933 [Fusarium oxysporum Fo47]
MYYHFAVLLLFRPLIKLRIIGSTVLPRDVCLQVANAMQSFLTSYSRLYAMKRTPSFMPYFVLTPPIMRLAIMVATVLINELDTAALLPSTIHANSADLSFVFTPATNFSDYAMFSSFAQEKLYVHPEIDSDDGPETPLSSRSMGFYTISPADHASTGVSDDPSRSGTPGHGEHTNDDMAASNRPSHQVDYLSHNWRDEDIWSSWRYIAMRRGELPNSIRLKNAVWRTRVKTKNNMKTISPETLDWLLYVPLCSVQNALNSVQTELSKVPLPRTYLHVNLDRNPILRKRSMSEETLQIIINMEETRDILGPHTSRSTTDYPYQPFSQRRLGEESSSANTSTESSEVTSRNCERKHTHFNERGVDHDNDELDTGHYGDGSDPGYDIMVKRTKTRKSLLFQRKTSESKPAKGETIAMLPSTTLKYREDAPEPRGTARKPSRSPIIPSLSQGIVRLAKKPPMLFIGEENDDDSLNHLLLSPGTDWPSSPAEDANSGLSRSLFSESLCEVFAGMRTIPSGMFTLYEEGGVSSTDGILERVIDTVNTARDIAHVIWSVGWKK